MQNRGKTSPGDKTDLDVIVAARDAAKNQSEGLTFLHSINQSVNDPINCFRNRQSQVGIERVFWEKSIGLDDPGMLAFKRMFESLEIDLERHLYRIKDIPKRQLKQVINCF
jgi:dihydroxyacetone kinase-like protein